MPFAVNGQVLVTGLPIVALFPAIPGGPHGRGEHPEPVPRGWGAFPSTVVRNTHVSWNQVRSIFSPWSSPSDSPLSRCSERLTWPKGGSAAHLGGCRDAASAVPSCPDCAVLFTFSSAP